LLSGDQASNFVDVDMDDRITLRLTFGDSHHADATLQCLATNDNPDYLARSRNVAVVKICTGLVFSALKANVT
jgi:hypothetical protein